MSSQVVQSVTGRVQENKGEILWVAIEGPPAGSVAVTFDNFAAAQPPAPGELVRLYRRGWQFGRSRQPIWSLEPPPQVRIEELEVDLLGFRRGRRRHLKYLLHDVGFDRAAFRRKSRGDLTTHRDLASAEALRAAAEAAGCPAIDHGQGACSSADGVPPCAPSAFWRYERSLTSSSRRYECEALSVAASGRALLCLTTDRLAPSDPGDRLSELRLLLAADPRAKTFVMAATVVSDPLRFSLLTAYIPDKGDPIKKLSQRLARASHVSRIWAPPNLLNTATLLAVRSGLLASRRTGVFQGDRR